MKKPKVHWIVPDDYLPHQIEENTLPLIHLQDYRDSIESIIDEIRELILTTKRTKFDRRAFLMRLITIRRKYRKELK